MIDSSQTLQGFVSGVVPSEVKGSDGRVAIPAGSRVTMLIRRIGRIGPTSVVDLGLYSINILGKEFSFSNGIDDAAVVKLTDDAGLGPGHNAVHLQYGNLLQFRLDRSVQLL